MKRNAISKDHAQTETLKLKATRTSIKCCRTSRDEAKRFIQLDSQWNDGSLEFRIASYYAICRDLHNSRSVKFYDFFCGLFM